MSWEENNILDQRLNFINSYLNEGYSIAELSREFGISRPTAHKFIKRYNEEGPAGLHDKSRAPYNHPNAVPLDIVERVLAFKAEKMTWGPRKIYERLKRISPETKWPVASTIGIIFERHGLIQKYKKRRKASPSPHLTKPDGPNSVWYTDFKGWFKTKDGKKCHPLTITDGSSRYIIRCQGLLSEDTDSSMAVFAGAFMEFGLPAVIRSDNGSPFASVAPAGLSRLSLWFLKLGIMPERTKLGHPEENGSHENMHRHLKKDIVFRSPAVNLFAQQKDFDRFVNEFNYERPHGSLEYMTPSDFYVPSDRPFPLLVPGFIYPEEYTARSVHKNGCIRWKGREIFISEVYIGEFLGMYPIEKKYWEVYIGPIMIGILDEGERKLISGKDVKILLKELKVEGGK